MMISKNHANFRVIFFILADNLYSLEERWPLIQWTTLSSTLLTTSWCRSPLLVSYDPHLFSHSLTSSKAYNDMLRDPSNPKYAAIAKYKELGLTEKSYSNAEMEKSLSEFTKVVYHEKVGPATVLPKNIGNSYCGSLYAGLTSLLSECDDGMACFIFIF